jgi:hypothetical protein
MKKIQLLVVLLVCSFVYAQEGSNYTITINGESFEYSLGETIEYDAKKKGPLKISVSQKDNLTYNDGIIVFNHPKSFPISETQLDEGIKQITAINSSGMGFIIQEYEGINPSLMVDLMLNEVTKESVEYGYSETISSVEFNTKDNKVLKGKKSVLEYQGVVDEWVVVTYSWKDGGVLIATMAVDTTDPNVDANFADNFYKSLRIIPGN